MGSRAARPRLAGETPEARDKRIQERLEEATGDLGRAIIRLRLEEGGRSSMHTIGFERCGSPTNTKRALA